MVFGRMKRSLRNLQFISQFTLIDLISLLMRVYMYVRSSFLYDISVYIIA